MFTYLPAYSLLICCEHRCAVYSLDGHLRRQHRLPAAKRRLLLTAYSQYALVLPDSVATPESGRAPFAELGLPLDAFACSYQSSSSSRSIVCPYISVNKKEMQQHLNQQHQVRLTCWATRQRQRYSNAIVQL